MNIFCILKNENQLRRVSLSQELQKSLADYIAESINRITNIDESKRIQFNGEYKPDEDEILYIENFENPYERFDASSTELLRENEIDDIKAIAFLKESVIAYQCFDNRKIIRPEKWYLIYSSDTYSKIDKKGLIIDSKIDALYLVNEMHLLFNSYHNASKIFDLSNFYKEATDKEIDNFFQPNLFQITNAIDKELFTRTMRKKLYLIQKNNVMEKVQNNFDAVSDYAQKFNLSDLFDVQNKRIIIPNDKKQLESFLNFLNDDLYNSPITNNKYKTNSKITFNN